MSDSNQAKSPKPDIVDIEDPEKIKPTSTSKPIIVSNHPVLKDPMVVGDTTEDEEKSNSEAAGDERQLSHAGVSLIQPPGASESNDTEEKNVDEEPSAVPEVEAKDQKPENPEETSDKEEPKAPVKKQAQAKITSEPEPTADVQKLVDEGEYMLPINSSEERRSKRFVVAGVVVATVLILAWLDVALDAHIISLDSVHPATHFFSN